MSSLAESLYTPEDYLAMERKAPRKSEYLRGRVWAMSGASFEHNTITFNLAGILRDAFRRKPCQGFTSDMRVKVSTTGLYTYPDVVAVCGGPVFDDRNNDTLTNPQVIFEVLSPSTEAYDRGEKFAHYRRLETLTDYVLVSQDKCRVEHFARQDSLWVLNEISALEDILHLASIRCDLPLREIYDKVDFPSTPNLPFPPPDEDRVR